ncbi:1021_t:CDS:2 [Diversispora eburnea]|uniref:1021_t:CDS:1 n=1 Tax=Diversispora eburnea TaxID=1213867 RepID=A0A9N9FL61_9GLOM|nr:1021_t:CDS:2 [Diversispora eburnea]
MSDGPRAVTGGALPAGAITCNRVQGVCATAGATLPAGAVACNVVQGVCMASCAASFLCPIP